MGKPAIGYLRVSGKGQVKGDGFARQREAIEDFAHANGFEIAEEFRDEGISGTKELADRPGLAEVLERVESNGVRVVIVERADRLARDLMVSEVILDQFRKIGVQLFEADGGTELTVGNDDPTRKLIRQVLAAVAEFDKSVLVLKLRAARERKRRLTGRCEGRRGYGLEVLELIKELRRKPPGRRRPGNESIARELNARGVPTMSGRPWNTGTVAKILAHLDERIAAEKELQKQ